MIGKQRIGLRAESLGAYLGPVPFQMFKPFQSYWVAALLLWTVFPLFGQRQMERLGRGVVVVRPVSSQAYIGWRLLGTDPSGIGFNVYRSANGGAATKLNALPLTNSCNVTDSPNFAVANSYFVRPVIDGLEQTASAAFTLPANAPIRQHLSIPLQPPGGGTTPDGVPYTYTANDCSVADLDGDGEYELVLKWDPTNSKDNSQSGYTGNVFLDGYKLDGTRLWRIDLGRNIRAGAHYTQFMVYDLDGDGRAEVACKTAPGTVDALGKNVLLGGDSAAADYRNGSGYVLSGPEYFTLFDGLTGRELATTNYVPARGSVSAWGDSYGNRVDRFLACVAFLDGQRPSVVMCRGYYTRAALTAWDWRDGKLTRRWAFDTGDSGGPWSGWKGQGAHSLTVGDVDGDGKDEITYGAAAIDDDGTGLYNTALGHGDALHMSKMDPDRVGQQVWMVHEDPGSYGPTGLEFRDAATGALIFGLDGQGADVGRGVAIDIDPRYRGYEMWGSRGGLMSASGEQITSSRPSQMNFALWWDSDLLREILDGTQVRKWNWSSSSSSSVLSPNGLSSNNSTKSTPCLSADILGDWREEVIWRTADNSDLQIYTTVSVATNRLYTLMHDPQYRLAIAWQNVAYNQPPHPGFYLGPDMPEPPRPPISEARLTWRGGLGGNVWNTALTPNWFTNNLWVSNTVPTVFDASAGVLFDLSGSNNGPVALVGTLMPASVEVRTPKPYVWSGSGSLEGGMALFKDGSGALTIANTNGFTGPTSVRDGGLWVNGALLASPVTVEGLTQGAALVGGIGRLGGGLVLKPGAALSPGTWTNLAGTLTVSNQLIQAGGVLNLFDLSTDPTGMTNANDVVEVAGNLGFKGTNIIRVNPLGGYLPAGLYPLIRYSGSLTGGLANLRLEGTEGYPVVLKSLPGMIALESQAIRPPTDLVWKGGTGNVWNSAGSSNWLNGGVAEWFVPGDRVRFDATGAANTVVTLSGTLLADSVTVDAATSYTLAGSGVISGDGGLTKTNSGTLTISGAAHTFTGPTVIGGGTLSVAALASGGLPSAIGASSGNSGSLVLAGGTLRYTGGSTVVERGATLTSGGGSVEVVSSGTTLTLSGVLAGTGKLTKTGAGTLELGGSSTYSGGTLVNAGTLELGTPFANGAGLGTGPVTLANGSRLALYASSSGDTGAGGPFVSTLIVPAGATATLWTPFRFAFNGALQGSGTLNLRVNGVRGDFGGNGSAFTGQINVSTYSGAGVVRMTHSAGWPNARVKLLVNADLQNRIGGTPTLPVGELAGDPGSFLTASGGNNGLPAIWRVGGLNTSAVFAGAAVDGVGFVKEGTGTWIWTGTNSHSGTTTISGGVLQIGNGGTSGTAGTGPLVNNDVLAFRRADDLVHAGAISGSGELRQLGPGRLTLSAVNPYSGRTTVLAGTLALAGAGSISASTEIALSAGALLDVSGRSGGGMSISSGQTLSGDGTVAGTITVTSGATLSPGFGIGRLTFENALALGAGSVTRMEMNPAAGTNDSVRVVGGLTLGGTLVVTNSGSGDWQVGLLYRLFDAGSLNGAFASIQLPTLPAGLEWNTSALAVSGELSVMAVVPPVLGPISVAPGGTVQLTVLGVAGQGYAIRASTNVALTPLSLWDVLGTGVFHGAPIQFEDPQATNWPERFYRLEGR